MLTGLSRLKSVLNADFLQHRNREDKIDIIFWELRDIEQTLKELRYNQPYKHVIVDIHTHKIKEFLQAAAAMGLLTTYHHYMFTSLVGKACFLFAVADPGGCNSANALPFKISKKFHF